MASPAPSGPATKGVSPQMEAVRAEEPHQSNDDQVDGNDIVQQARNDQDENAGEQRYHRPNTQIDVHSGLRDRLRSVVSYSSAFRPAIGTSGPNGPRRTQRFERPTWCLAHRGGTRVRQLRTRIGVRHAAVVRRGSRWVSSCGLGTPGYPRARRTILVPSSGYRQRGAKGYEGSAPYSEWGTKFIR